jgi:hypothetical protein
MGTRYRPAREAGAVVDTTNAAVRLVPDINYQQKSLTL